MDNPPKTRGKHVLGPYPDLTYALELEVMAVVSRSNAGYLFSLRDIAEVCGVSREIIRLIERRALHKVCKKLSNDQSLKEDLHTELRQMDREYNYLLSGW